MPRSPRAFIVAGANGVGKTTLAGEFLKRFHVRFLNVDDIVRETSDGSNDRVSHIGAGRLFFRELEKEIRSHASFALESTLSGRYLVRIIRSIQEKEYKVSIIYFFVDTPEISINRIKIRVEKGGHYVPDKDVIRRFFRSRKNFWLVYRNIADNWSLWYNSEHKLVQAASGEKEDIKVKNEKLFHAFTKDMKDD